MRIRREYGACVNGENTERAHTEGIRSVSIRREYGGCVYGGNAERAKNENGENVLIQTKKKLFNHKFVMP